MSSTKVAGVNNAYIDQMAVDATAGTETIRRGMPVKYGTAGLDEASAATDEVLGIAYSNEDGDWPATSGERVNYVRLGSPCTVKALVAAAGVTARKHVVAASGGVVDMPTSDPDGTTTCTTCGQADSTQVSGDFVSLYLGFTKTIDYTP
jgi:hypothetical protein